MVNKQKEKNYFNLASLANKSITKKVTELLKYGHKSLSRGWLHSDMLLPQRSVIGLTCDWTYD